MPALGERFRDAREARNLSLSDVAEQIRIRSVYLAAIENENWPAIGAPIYVRGFLRTYARFLSMDPEEAVRAFNAATAEPGGEISEAETQPQFRGPVAIPEERRGFSPLIWIAGAVAVLLIVYVVYDAVTYHSHNAQVAVASGASASPTPAGTDSGASPTPKPFPNSSSLPLGPHTLALTLSAPSWLRVTIDGSNKFEGVAKAGSIRTFQGNNAVVRIGNAGGVEVTVDGKSIGTLGKSGDVVERTFTL